MKRNRNRILFGNPVFRATITASVKRDMEQLKTLAELQVWASDHAANMVYMTSRLLWIVDRAAHICQIPMDTPEMRVIGGAANALSDLAARQNELEIHRPALQAGIMAADRLWPRLDVFALGNAAIDFNEAVQNQGITAHDFHLNSGNLALYGGDNTYPLLR